MRSAYIAIVIIFLIEVCLCKPYSNNRVNNKNKNMTISTFGQTTEGENVNLYTIKNNNGIVLKMMNYGAIVISFDVPDREGNISNINLGYRTLEGYLKSNPYFGATIGRFGNRIANGKFSLNGEKYQLPTNDGSNHLHGGNLGFDKVLWDAKTFENGNESGIEFTYLSPDGDQGYPGNLMVTAIYTLTNDNKLKVEFSAETDKPTPINLTNHNYWNLGGAGTGSILEHDLTINADSYLEVDNTLIPTGKLISVDDTPFDFRSIRKIGKSLFSIPEIENLPQGYDHCFVLNDKGESLRLAATVKHQKSGRKMEIFTNQPAIQFYSGNFLDGSSDSGGYQQYHGFCLETQHYPDSPNHSHFPSTVLYPGSTYYHLTVHQFSFE